MELYGAYRRHPDVEEVVLLLPANAALDGEGGERILLPDDRTGSRWHFLWRHFVNPLILLRYLLKSSKGFGGFSRTQQPGQTFVLLNDFEQMSAPLWAPLFRWLLRGIKMGVFLHDADRDAYPPSPAISGWCMKQMMRCAHLALFHGTLPQRSYYHPNGKTTYLCVKHGLYPPAVPDAGTLHAIAEWGKGLRVKYIIPGHIRPEKNYEMAIQALVTAPDAGLIIAGSPANSNITTHGLRRLALEQGVANRVLWLEQYLSEPEMSAALSAADVVLLYYAGSFHAQSGILNQVVPLRKPVITGNLPNALTETVKEYQLGWVVEADNPVQLARCMQLLDPDSINPQWDRMTHEVAWDKQVGEVMDKVNRLMRSVGR